jgi:hypothetical protein
MGIACLPVLMRCPDGNNVCLFSLNCSVEGLKADISHSVPGIFSLVHILNEARFYQQWTWF